MENKTYSYMELKVLREKAENGDEEAKEILVQELATAMLEDAAATKKKWLQKNGFNENEETFIVTGETYSIREQLKRDGFYYNPILKWHRSYPEGYEDVVVRVTREEVATFALWGAGSYLPEAQSYIENLIAGTDERSEWVGNVGDKLNSVSLTLLYKNNFTNRWGNLTYIYNFKDNDNNHYTWFTSKNINRGIGDVVKLSAVIKSHSEYKGQKSTVLTKVTINAA